MLLAASSPPVQVHLVSSVPGWLTLLLTFLVGTAAALASSVLVQLYIVPRVERRKRREDRWERDVLELGQLLAKDLTDRANDTHAAQLVFRDMRGKRGHNRDALDRCRMDAEQAVWTYGGLISTELDWLVDRVLSLRNAPEISQFRRAVRDYRQRALSVRVLPDGDRRTDDEFHDQWQKESDARKALIEQVKALAG